MKVCAWMLFGALFVSPAWTEEPAPASDPAAKSAPADQEAARDKSSEINVVVLDAEMSRQLRKFIAQRAQAAAPTDANTSPTVSGELKPIPQQRVRKPYAMGCDDFDCYTFDRSGKVIEKIPRDTHYGKFGDDPAGLLACQGESNLLSTFERDAHCRGLGNGLVNPYRPVETAAELDR